MKATYHGHAVVSLETDDGTKLLFDPFITGNDLCDLDAETVEPDVILLTHAHADHFGDTVEIAKRTGAQVITTVEIADYLSTLDVEAHGMQPGGAHEFDFGVVKFTQAIHGSSLDIDDSGKPFTLGLAAGILVTADKRTVYHVGDTALYSDMRMIGERNYIDLAFIPIGDNFTMGPEDAAVAARWLQADCVVPVHYNTFPLIEQDPDDFVNRLGEGVGIALKVGQTLEV
jgi:L-ascorbate metabolism protein UlaG (beta-lactamase superfamily)